MRHQKIQNRKGKANGSRRVSQSTSIVLQDYAVEMFLGIHDFEKKRQQRVLLSVSLELQDPSNFWNYDRLIEHFQDAISGARVETQEELCEMIIKFVEDGPPLNSVVVQTKKPDVYNEAEFISVRRRVVYSDTHLT